MSKKPSKAQIKRNRKAWVEALRSGKYKQTKGKLKSRNGAYCCLGVLCEVAEVPRLFSGGEYNYGDLDAIRDDRWMDYSATALPPVAQDWLGVSTSDPMLAKPVTVKDNYGDEIEVTNLISLNDDHGWSFEQIADAVEKNGLADD